MAESQTTTEPSLGPCPWCPTERREIHKTEGGFAGVIIHDLGCYLARHEDDRRQVLTPHGVTAWNSRVSASVAPNDERADEIAKQFVDDLFCDGALVPAERLVLAGKGQLTGRTGWSKDAVLKRVRAAISSTASASVALLLALSTIAEWAREGQQQSHAGLHSLLGEIEALARASVPPQEQSEPWRDQGGHAWEILPNVECVECPHCLFIFAAIHTSGEDYSCPNCEGCPDASPVAIRDEAGPRLCAKCGHNDVWTTDGYCDTRSGPDGAAIICGCKCVFMPATSPPSIRAKAAAAEIAHRINSGEREDLSYPQALLAMMGDPSIANEAAFAAWLEPIIERCLSGDDPALK